MLTLQSYPVWLRVCLLVGMLTWLLRIPLVLVFCLIILVVLLIGEMVLALVGIFSLAVPMLSLLLRRAVLRKRGLPPHLLARFRIAYWMADVSCPIASQPFWPACWLDTLDRSSSSSSRAVQDVWDVYRDVLGVVPEQVIHALRDAASRSSVDDFWSIWSKSAEAGLLHAYTLAGGPIAAGSSAFLGRGFLRIRRRRLGGQAVGGRSSSRLYRASHSDEVDSSCAQFFVNSSLSPVLLFRRRLKSVAGVPKGIRDKGFTQARWDALVGFWEAVCRHGPCGPISSLHPWDTWLHPDLHGFYRWVFDSIEVLNGFLRQVVVSRRDEGIRRWKGWLREDMSSRPYIWLRPDFVPPSPFFVVHDPHTQSSQILVEPHLIDAEFRKAWMPYLCRSGHPEVSSDRFLGFIGHFFASAELPWNCLVSLVATCKMLLVPKKLLLVVWMVGLGMRLKLFPCLGFLGLLFFWNLLSLLALGLRVFWMRILP